ncbi:ATP-binding protein [Pseudonocardia sp.]|uniref:sensor histidine kinase n=1 Tax=Pseudonocardia sp. TaxID=60912 RepID=UPI003D0AAC28
MTAQAAAHSGTGERGPPTNGDVDGTYTTRGLTMRSKITEAVSGAGRPVALLDSVLVLGALALLAAICIPLEQALPADEITIIMALFAAAAGTTAAMLAVIAARLTDDHRLTWITLALGCYSLVVIPTAAAGALGAAPAPMVGAVRSLLHCLVVALLVTALVAPAPLNRWQTVGAAICAVGLAIGVAGLGSAFPAAGNALSTNLPIRYAVAASWTIAAVAVALQAARNRSPRLSQVGAGIAVIGLAHFGQINAGDIASPGDLGLVFSTIRMAGVIIVLWASLNLAREAVGRLDAHLADHEEQLRLADIRLARAAERDHELRNGLAGLAGATNLLGVRDDPQAALLGTVVASELSRLDELLRTPADRPRPAPVEAYAVTPVLHGLVALRSSTGMDIHLEADPGLRVLGSSRLLTQVLTNVLANAAAHAPGSPVDIRARHRGVRVVIEVSDRGPGVAPGKEEAVFEPGHRRGESTGLGLGLHISRRLVTGQGGTISIRPADPLCPGCTVVVDLPAAEVSSAAAAVGSRVAS